MVITYIKGLITPLITTHEPPNGLAAITSFPAWHEHLHTVILSVLRSLRANIPGRRRSLMMVVVVMVVVVVLMIMLMTMEMMMRRRKRKMIPG